MEKVIYINYMKQLGHLHFDQIQIDALVAQGYDVKLVMHQEIALQLPYPKEMYALVLPSWTDTDSKHSWMVRLHFLLTLLWIKFHIDESHFDHCVVSNIDEVSMGLCPLRRGMHLMCHGSAQGFGQKLKTFFLRKLSRRNTFLVFNDDMQQPFLQHGITSVKIISHGCLPAFKESTTLKESQGSYNSASKPCVIFQASSKSDDRFWEMICAPKMDQALRERNVLLILRGTNAPDSSFRNFSFGSIKVIPNYLSGEAYRQAFAKADIILLAYPPSFRYQVSGVSYECIANQKPLLAWRNPALSYCKDFYSYDPFFDSAEEFLAKIDFLRAHREIRPKVTREELVPQYQEILKKQ